MYRRLTKDLASVILARVALTLRLFLVHRTVILVHKMRYCMILEVKFFLLLRSFIVPMTVAIILRSCAFTSMFMSKDKHTTKLNI